MHCPACKTNTLRPSSLDNQLPAQHCSTCDGNWLNADQYFAWLDQQPARLSEKPYEGPTLELADTQHAKLCPSCMRIMLRYEVGHDTQVTLDQCAACDGIWLDHHEWEALKGRNLHDEIHLVFTAPWQSQVRKDASKARLTSIYQQRFGEHFSELKRLHDWLHQQPNKSDMLSFLSKPDPFDH